MSVRRAPLVSVFCGRKPQSGCRKRGESVFERDVRLKNVQIACAIGFDH